MKIFSLISLNGSELGTKKVVQNLQTEQEEKFFNSEKLCDCHGGSDPLSSFPTVNH